MRTKADGSYDKAAVEAVASAAARWITPELIQRTIEVWQPRSPVKLMRENAVAILENTARLFSVLSPRHSMAVRLHNEHAGSMRDTADLVRSVEGPAALPAPSDVSGQRGRS